MVLIANIPAKEEEMICAAEKEGCGQAFWMIPSDAKGRYGIANT
jgi:hypothetical protein